MHAYHTTGVSFQMRTTSSELVVRLGIQSSSTRSPGSAQAPRGRKPRPEKGIGCPAGVSVWLSSVSVVGIHEAGILWQRSQFGRTSCLGPKPMTGPSVAAHDHASLGRSHPGRRSFQLPVRLHLATRRVHGSRPTNRICISYYSVLLGEKQRLSSNGSVHCPERLRYSAYWEV